MTAEHSSHAHPSSLSQLLSLVAHELRSPINTINGFLDLTLEGVAGELNEQQQEFLQRARAGSEHLYALLEDLLLIARADSEQLRLRRTSCALEELVEAALEELELTAREAEVTVEAVLPIDLPLVSVDAVRVQQVVRDLLSNALHFTPANGHVTITAQVVPASQEEQKPMLEVRVQDNGCGIAPAYHEQIFERFFQAPRSEGGRASGQGLGLAVVKLLVELHGGHVLVESEPGVGSTFLFTLNALT
jgi:signal transduction histidine kinase